MICASYICINLLETSSEDDVLWMQTMVFSKTTDVLAPIRSIPIALRGKFSGPQDTTGIGGLLKI
jgi:hypothetical protein